MLGIRRFRECQLDLWVGDQADFFVDHLFQNIEEFNSSDLKKFQNKHVAIVGSTEQGLWNIVRRKLEFGQNLPRRITVTFTDVKSYDLQQENLFSEFK